MNPVLESLIRRKSVRAFTSDPIPPEVKRAVLPAASNAPTAGCQQLYTILDITDQTLKEKLAVTCDDQPFIASAPMVLIFCADAQKWYDAYVSAGCAPRAPGAGDLMLAVEDAVIAAQNAVTAAWSLGVGSCYIGDIMENREAHRELLDLPPYVFPATMVVFGYPAPGQAKRRKPERYDPDFLVSENRYPRRSGEKLLQILSANSRAKSPEAWMRAFCWRKYQSDFAREMSRSVRAYLAAFAPEEEAPERRPDSP
jgi:nitroreductase